MSPCSHGDIVTFVRIIFGNIASSVSDVNLFVVCLFVFRIVGKDDSHNRSQILDEFLLQLNFKNVDTNSFQFTIAIVHMATVNSNQSNLSKLHVTNVITQDHQEAKVKIFRKHKQRSCLQIAL